MYTSPDNLLIKPNYIILDAARLLNRMDEAKELNDKWSSLYTGTTDEGLIEVAPYIFSFITESEFAKWCIEKCLGNACGIFLYSSFSFEEVNNHFKNLLLVQTEKGQELYFRFYDPRVLRVFLPTCDIPQLEELFGPIDQFICEDENADFVSVYTLHNNSLKVSCMSWLKK